MADRPVRPRHRPGAKRIDPEPVEKSKPPKDGEAPESPAPVEATDVTEVAQVAEVAGAGVPRQARPRRTPAPSETWRPRPRGLIASEVRDRWNEAQGEFVDDPPRSVRDAHALAAEVADAVIAEIQARRATLHSVWNDTEADTETLRLALHDYRSFVRQLAGEA